MLTKAWVIDGVYGTIERGKNKENVLVYVDGLCDITRETTFVYVRDGDKRYYMHPALARVFGFGANNIKKLSKKKRETATKVRIMGVLG